jgi:hypothetical protein
VVEFQVPLVALLTAQVVRNKVQVLHQVLAALVERLLEKLELPLGLDMLLAGRKQWQDLVVYLLSFQWNFEKLRETGHVQLLLEILCVDLARASYHQWLEELIRDLADY